MRSILSFNGKILTTWLSQFQLAMEMTGTTSCFVISIVIFSLFFSLVIMMVRSSLSEWFLFAFSQWGLILNTFYLPIRIAFFFFVKCLFKYFPVFKNCVGYQFYKCSRVLYVLWIQSLRTCCIHMCMCVYM